MRMVLQVADCEAGASVNKLRPDSGTSAKVRRTFDIFRGYWPDQTDPANPIAATINTLSKYVASNSLGKDDATWRGEYPDTARLVTGDGVLPATMRSVSVSVTESGIVLGTYEPAGPVGHGRM